LPGTVIYAGIAAIGSAPAASIGLPGNETKRIVLMFFVNLVMNLILVPHFAAVGAAAATSIALLSAGVIYFFYLLSKHLDFTVSISKYSILFIVFCLLMVFIAKFVNTILYFPLFITGLTIIITVLITLRMICKSDWELICSMFKSITAKT
jgi:O-antigen/teichoic acid export membrane protein